ncbi:hypothetical protein [Paenimyroides marinum]|nr:hypothetical protein [Paenimyroides aquimaris]
MDIWLLNDLLPDTIYQGATKSKFLEKIEKAFIALKKEGDTSLESFEGISHSEKDSWNRTGFSFVGNHSRKHIDFIFEGTAFDEITNIYNCNDLELFDKTVRRKQQIPIDILHQERANYKRYKKYHTYDERYISAINELLQYKETIIGVEIYAQWLEKHQQLYNRTLPNRKVGLFKLIVDALDKKGKDANPQETSISDNFYWMYRHIKEVYEDYYLPKHKDAKKAIEEYNELNLADENDLLKWLVKYEETYNKLGFFMDLYLEDDDTEFFEIHNVRLKTSDFEYIIKLCHLSTEHYYDMLDKYTTSKNGDLYDFEQKFIQSVREKHILDSKNKYLNYLQQYENLFRNKPKIKDEEEFVKYLKNTNNDDFLHKYIREYCEEEFKQHNKEYNEMSHNFSSLTYHLKQRGIIL